MPRKTASAIMLFLLVIGTLTLAFQIQSVKADGATIYINAGGSMTPSTASIYSADNITYTLTGNITTNGDGIVIDRDNIVLNGAGYTLTGSGSGTGTTLTDRSNVTVRNMAIENFTYGIYLNSSSDSSLSGNTVRKNNEFGIGLLSSSNNVLSGNNATDNMKRAIRILEGAGGIGLDSSSDNNTLSGNNVMANFPYGIWLNSSSNNALSGNNATGNGEGIFLLNSFNNTLSGNDATSSEVGIWLMGGVGNTLSGNNATANLDDGIYLWFGSSNVLVGNKVTDNNLGGIDLSSSFGNVLSGNNVANNQYGIFPGFSSNSTLSGNVMAGNQYNFGVYGSALSDYMQSVDTSNLVDGRPVFYFVNQSDMVVNANAYPDVGFLGFVNCVNVTAQGLNLTKNEEGLLLAFTNNSRIIDNNVANNDRGIFLCNSSNDVFSGNNVTTNNDHGIWLANSSNNVFYHNNFLNNNQQAHIENPDQANSWDNGYPSGGNYWSDYTGTDLYRGQYQNQTGSDGIGDTPYIIDANNTDHYPLVGMFSNFNVAEGIDVQVVSNSTLSDFHFNGTAILLNVSGTNGTTGFCNVCVPTALINGTLTVLVNGTQVQYSLLPSSNSNNSYLYFTYSHSTEPVTIIPEFPSAIIWLFFAMVALCSAILHSKKHAKILRFARSNKR